MFTRGTKLRESPSEEGYQDTSAAGYRDFDALLQSHQSGRGREAPELTP